MGTMKCMAMPISKWNAKNDLAISQLFYARNPFPFCILTYNSQDTYSLFHPKRNGHFAILPVTILANLQNYRLTNDMGICTIAIAILCDPIGKKPHLSPATAPHPFGAVCFKFMRPGLRTCKTNPLNIDPLESFTIVMRVVKKGPHLLTGYCWQTHENLPYSLP